MVLPVVDSFLPESEQYLPRDPKLVLQSGDYDTMPVLTGTASHEGAVTMCECTSPTESKDRIMPVDQLLLET